MSKALRSRRRIAETRFGNIAYVERGAGDGALFLHGFPLNGFQWRGALDRLSVHRRCVAPDFLGLGYTEVAEGQSVALDAQVAMLVELMDALSIPSADIVANDSGAPSRNGLPSVTLAACAACFSPTATPNPSAHRPHSCR